MSYHVQCCTRIKDVGDLEPIFGGGPAAPPHQVKIS